MGKTKQVLLETYVKLGLDKNKSGIDMDEVENSGRAYIVGRGTEDVYVKQLRNLVDSILDITLLL